MTTSLFIVLMLLIITGAFCAFVLSTRPAVAQLVKRNGTMPPPMIGAISILFGLFVGFSSAEITQRGGSLRLSTQREVSAARSIVNFTTGVGPRAYPVREAINEYLQVVTTTERDWLLSRAPSEPPGAGPVYSLNLITTGFVQPPGVSDVLKSALINRVDDLTNARTERLTLSRGAGSIPQWVGLTVLAIVTQLVGAMAVAGQRGGGVIFLTGFSVTALVGLAYLGWADGLIGPSRSQEQTAPFETLLGQIPRLVTTEEDTAARMRNTGRVVIGARTDQYPFAYVGPRGDIVGYSLDLCRGIIERVRTAAGLGPIQVDVLGLSPANRVAMIVNSTADMECDLTTETSVRDSQVDFLDPIFFGKAQIVLRAASPIVDVAGLRGKRVIAVVGSSNIQAATDLDSSRHLGITIVPATDMPEAFRMLGENQGDALIGSDVLNRTLIVQSGHPEEYRVLDEGMAARAYGIMVRRSNDTFKASALRALRAMAHAGDIEKTFNRWCLSPPEPGSLNLNLPMSADCIGSLTKLRNRACSSKRAIT